MWRSWAKSAARNHTTSASSSLFSLPSFKDVRHLLADEFESLTPRRAAVLHRTKLAPSLVRTNSDQLPKSEPKPEPAEPKFETKNVPSTSAESPPPTSSERCICLPGTESRVVVYFTSLRVVRSTFEDCKTVRSILTGFRVPIDERDLSMDSGFMAELQGIMGCDAKLMLPRVFIGGRYVGGAEEVRQLHETGELKRLVEGLPSVEPGVCDMCGGYGFILCLECNGSHKCYTGKGGFRSCLACNENGLIRCPSCSCAPLSSVRPISIKM